MNTLKTTILMATLTGLLVIVGNAVGGMNGMVMAFAIALLMNGVTYWFSDRIVLKMHRAQELAPGDAPEVHRMVERLCQRANQPKPRLYLLPDEGLNAFATGRDPHHAAVAYTAGILRQLGERELEGVTAHELAHIGNRDMLIGTIAAVMAGAITMVASMVRWAAVFGGIGGSDEDEEGGGAGGILGFVFLAIVAPLAAMLIQLAVSRSREYLADATAAQTCGNPRGLANALRRLGQAAPVLPTHTAPATAHLFIVNPLTGGGLLSLFSTHPPIEQRIARLEAMPVR
jgi:heat shock protein HtpX